MAESLLEILTPITDEDFFARFHEREPLHIERLDAQHFASLIHPDDIEQLLSRGDQWIADIQITDANREVRVSDYCGDDQRVDPAAVRRLFLEGSTLVLNRAHVKVPAIADLCRAVTRRFVMRSQANVYFSPASQQGFNPHFDTHDVFILQVSGAKTFSFYQSDIELPYTDDTFDPSYCEAPVLQQQVTLSAGDTLYIPRGVVHDAVASGQSPSLHITLGVFPMMVRDLLQEAIQIAGEREVVLRKSVTGDTGFTEVRALLEQVLNDETCHQAHDRLMDEVALGGLATTNQALVSGPLTTESVVRVNRANLINTESHSGQLKLRLFGQILEFETDFAKAVGYLLTQDLLRVGDIPALDRDQQLALCIQLQSAGLLVVEASGYPP
jgi:ribosomal protein L16 Arg81 hydroxylase